ncbi:MAG TPA: transcription elongation factor GreA [Candidatus Syntrophosphaera sp.]|jgi:transcription elongation factor GreA|nr:transcription elongation factor GreA [Candidatus Syntrophosphaera sp.]
MDLSLFITQDGMDKIQRRIQFLLSERPEVIKAVAVAREFGDLSENAEYKAAREKQRQIDGEIDHLRRRAAHLKVVDVSAFPKDKIRFGSICQTREESSGEETCYQVVGVDELNFYDREGIQPVSVLSPIGKALLGKESGEIALVKAPIGDRHLLIVAIL